MTVYVDDVAHRFRGLIMCHLWADSKDQLMAFSYSLGLRSRWLQQPPKASWVHFDISRSMKEKALRLGAVLTDKYGPVEHVARLDIASAIPDRVARGERRLAQIAECRALRTAPEPTSEPASTARQNPPQ